MLGASWVRAERGRRPPLQGLGTAEVVAAPASAGVKKVFSPCLGEPVPAGRGEGAGAGGQRHH